MAQDLRCNCTDADHSASSKWANWEPAVEIRVGAYGTLNKGTGDFITEGDVYDSEFRKVPDLLGQSRGAKCLEMDPTHEACISSDGASPKERWSGWLNGTTKHGELAVLHAHDTCSWLYNTSQYMSWVSNDDSSTLWLQGKAGSGKTVLTYSVIEHLKKTSNPVIFFYCDSRDGKSTSAVDILRSLFYQLLQHLRVGTGVKAQAFINNLPRKGGDIFIDGSQLASYVSCAAGALQHPFVIIDALDKCHDIQKLLDILVEWNASGNMRVMVTSRPLQVIKQRLCDISPILIVSWHEFEERVSEDLSTFIETKLEACEWLRSVGTDIKKKVKSTLLKKAEGMFLWAKCQVDTLSQCSCVSQVWELLDELPVPVQELYDDIILDITKHGIDRKTMQRILAWLVCALRPIRLCELIEALTIDCDRLTMEPDRLRAAIWLEAYECTILPHLTLEADIGTRLLHILGSLVTYDEETDRITLLHSSLKTYLIDKSTNPRYYVDLGDAHEELAAACLCYLSFCLCGSLKSINDKPPFRITLDMDTEEVQLSDYAGSPLLEYVLSTSLNHLPFLSLENESILGDMLALELDIQRHPDEWNYLLKLVSHALPWPSMKHDFIIYILIVFSPSWLLEAFLRKSPSGRLNNYSGTNPLIYAAYFRAISHAQVLLSLGTDLNREGWLIDDSGQELPLVTIFQAKDESRDITEITVEQGIPVPSDLSVHITLNPSSVLVPVIRKLLFDHAKMVYSPSKVSGWSVDDALHVLPPTATVQAKDQASKMVELFLEWSTLVPLELFTGMASSPPSVNLSLRITMMLLQTNFFVDWLEQQRDRRFLLHSCIMLDPSPVNEQDLLEALWRLVQLNLDPCMPDLSGKTVFHLAAARGCLSVVYYLLSIGVPLPDDILFFVLEENSPLRPNANNGLEEIVMTLVASGCDVDSRNSDNYRPLQLAIIGGHVAAVKCLARVTSPLLEGLPETVKLAPRPIRQEIEEILVSSGHCKT